MIHGHSDKNAQGRGTLRIIARQFRKKRKREKHKKKVQRPSESKTVRFFTMSENFPRQKIYTTDLELAATNFFLASSSHRIRPSCSDVFPPSLMGRHAARSAAAKSFFTTKIAPMQPWPHLSRGPRARATRFDLSSRRRREIVLHDEDRADAALATLDLRPTSEERQDLT